MKVINRTKYDTRQLKTILCRIARTELADMAAVTKKKVVVTFVPARQQRSCSGYAVCRQAVIRIPTKPTAERWDRIRLDLASTIAHELHHLAGRGGGRENEYWMRRSVPYGRPETEEGRAKQRELYGWVLSIPLETAEPIRRHRAAIDPAKKIAAIDAKLKAWATKKKRAETAIAKYRKQRRYYEKKATTPVESAE